jgi:hypothetical protein
MKKIAIMAICLLLTSAAMAQQGEIRGKITDSSNGTLLPFATVVYTENGTTKGVVSDMNGEYKIKPLSPGRYDLVISYVGYNSYSLNGVQVSAEKITYADAALSNNNSLPPVEVFWEPPLIDPGVTAVMDIIETEEIEQSLERSVTGLVANSAGVYQKDEGGSLNVRGTRESSTLYVVDGIKMTGPFSLPKGAIAEISVLTGGIPAMYGDASGGVVLITTKSYRMK